MKLRCGNWDCKVCPTREECGKLFASPPRAADSRSEFARQLSASVAEAARLRGLLKDVLDYFTVQPGQKLQPLIDRRIDLVRRIREALEE